MPDFGSAPKSSCRLKAPAPMWRRSASERASTGSADTSRFQSFPAGKIGQPAISGPGGSARGGGGPASGGPGGTVEAAPWGPLLPHANASATAMQREGLTALTVGLPSGPGPVRPSRYRADERLHRGERFLGLLAMRGMAAPFEQRGVYLPACSPADRLHLRRGAVLVGEPLDDEDRGGDAGELIGEVPLPELRIEPGAVPAVEGCVHVLVVLRKPLAQAALLVGLLGAGDAREAHLLAEDMGRFEDEAAHRVIRGVEDGDGRAVAVADEHRIGDPRRLEYAAKQQGPVVHVPHRARKRRGRGGCPVIAAAVCEGGKPASPRELLGKVAPHRDRAEPLVEEHQGRPTGWAPGRVFEVVRPDADAVHGPASNHRWPEMRRPAGSLPRAFARKTRSDQCTSSWILVSLVSRTKAAPMTTVINATMIGYQSPW